MTWKVLQTAVTGFDDSIDAAEQQTGHVHLRKKMWTHVFSITASNKFYTDPNMYLPPVAISSDSGRPKYFATDQKNLIPHLIN